MPTRRTIHVTELIDRRPLGALQIRVVALCSLVALLDGFDVLAIGLAAPAMAPSLHVAPAQFGTVFSAALLGLMLGAFGLGPIADRVGRKRVLIASTASFGAFTLCTPLASSLNELLLLRLLAGVGLGGAMPSFISLVTEYVPRARRTALVGLLYAGFPLGGVIVGLLASWLIDGWGWPSLFYVGGIVPLVLSALLVPALPDSIGFLVASGGSELQIRTILARIDPDAVFPAGVRFAIDDEARRDAPLRHLFTDGRKFGTLLLWASYFATFLMLITNATWTPTLLRGAGIDAGRSALAVATFAFGSVIGTSLGGWLVGHFGARTVLPAAFVATGLTLGAVGYGAFSVALVMGLQGLAGLFLGAGSAGLIALAAVFYPTAIRSTGVGWAMGLGRLGSFAGPLAIGMLVSRGSPVGGTFAALGALALCAAAFTRMMRVDRPLPGIATGTCSDGPRGVHHP